MKRMILNSVKSAPSETKKDRIFKTAGHPSDLNVIAVVGDLYRGLPRWGTSTRSIADGASQVD